MGSGFARNFLHPLWLLSLLAACGGGGGGSGSGGGDSGSAPLVDVTFFPSTVQTTAPPKSANNYVVVTATVSNVPASTGTVYPVITVDKPVFIAAKTVITQLSANKYTADFALDTSQPVGTYKGNITLSLCTDPQCTNKLRLDNSSVPYEISIGDYLKFYVSHATGGVPSNANGNFTVAAGDTVTLGTFVPVDWPTADTAYYKIVSATPTVFTFKLLPAASSTVFDIPVNPQQPATAPAKIPFQFF